MAHQKLQFSTRSILARVRKGPVKLRELARGSENHEVRKRLNQRCCSPCGSQATCR